MTNKDNAIKAREIADEFANENIRPALRIAAEEMAEWKDQQFKEYLEKKKENLYYNTDTTSVCNYALIAEIINELFVGE